VKKPMYKEALTDWQKDFPNDVLERALKHARYA
jgi:hypothetical protein